MDDGPGQFANRLVGGIGWLLDVVDRLASPFTRGRQYRVQETFDDAGSFTAGEVLTFVAYDDSIKDPVVLFHFKDRSDRQRTFWLDRQLPWKERRAIARRRFERL